MENIKDSLFKLFEDSFKACNIAGQAQECTTPDKYKQLGYIKSEVAELNDAILAEDLVEQLDGCVDILVTVFGFMQKLQRQGAILEKAMVKTADNNLSKFPLTRAIAEKTAIFYKETKGKDCNVRFNPVYQQYVVRDENGKYLKPYGFIENNLSDCFLGSEKEVV